MERHRKTIYDLYDIHTWKQMPQYLADPGVEYRAVPRPENLEKMIDIAEKISQGFPQVRVDLYNVKGKIYFGEMTFTAFSGMNNHFTMEFQRMIGDRIKLIRAGGDGRSSKAMSDCCGV